MGILDYFSRKAKPTPKSSSVPVKSWLDPLEDLMQDTPFEEADVETQRYYLARVEHDLLCAEMVIPIGPWRPSDMGWDYCANHLRYLSQGELTRLFNALHDKDEFTEEEFIKQMYIECKEELESENWLAMDSFMSRGFIDVTPLHATVLASGFYLWSAQHEGVLDWEPRDGDFWHAHVLTKRYPNEPEIWYSD